MSDLLLMSDSVSGRTTTHSSRFSLHFFLSTSKDKKVEGLDTWYSAVYMREQQCFTIMEVAADWHELMVPRRSMQPSVSCDDRQVDPRRSTTDIPPPSSAALGLHPVPVARRLLLINRPRRDGTLSWRWYTTAMVRIWTHDLAIASPVPYHSATAYRQAGDTSTKPQA